MRATATNLINIKSLGLAVLSVALALTLVVSWLATAVNASSLIGVSSNVAEVQNGEDLVVKIKIQDDGDVHYLEVDHSLAPAFEEFYVYANEAAPHGDADDLAAFTAAGMTVAYSEANSEWTLDFGPTVTQAVVDGGGELDLFFVLRDSNDQILWGNMGDGAGTPTAPESSFSFDLVEGTGDSLVPEVVEDEAVVPGVPNTAVGR